MELRTSVLTVPVPAVKGFREALVGSVATVPQTVYAFHEQSTPAIRAMERPDLRKWPAYYDSTSQMLCQLGP
jgi:hypothetical protein